MIPFEDRLIDAKDNTGIFGYRRGNNNFVIAEPNRP